MQKTSDVKTYKRQENNEKKEQTGSLNLTGIIMGALTFIFTRASVYFSSVSFGPAFFVATFKRTTFLYSLPFMFIGGLSLYGISGAVKYLLSGVFFGIYKIIVSAESGESRIIKNVSVFISIFAAGIISMLLSGIFIYDVLLLLLEGLITVFAAEIFEKSIPNIKTFYKRRILNENEIIALLITASVFMLGIAKFNAIFGLVFIKAVSVLFLLIISYYQSITVSVMSAVILGFICVLGSDMTSVELPAILACGGICSSAFKKYGKIFMPLSFLAAISFMLMETGADNFINTSNGLILGCVLFALLPKKVLSKLEGLMSKNSLEVIREDNFLKFKNITALKLQNISSCFNDLKSEFLMTPKRYTHNFYDVSYIFKETCDKVCGNCGLSGTCWGKDYVATYEVMFKFLNKLNEKGHADKLVAPPHFRERCVKIDEFVQKVNNLYEVYEVNKKWENEVCETRTVIANHYGSIADIIENLSYDIKEGLGMDDEMNDKLITTADSLSVKLLYSTCYIESNGRLCAKVYIDKKESIKNILNAAEKAFGASMCVRERNQDDKGVHLLISEKEKYLLKYAVAHEAKNSQSGDSYKIIKTNDGGKIVVVLSDGMGSGAVAKQESGLAVSLFEKFIKAGFDAYTTSSIINSALFLKSAEDTFATIDIAIIDLYSGACEFIKIGSSASFIKKGETVDIIQSSSLPVGILRAVDLESSNKIINSDDIIIMLTDGVLDGMSDNVNKEEALKNTLSRIDKSSPTEIAKMLSELVKSKSGGNIKDDMSVIALKIEKAG